MSIDKEALSYAKKYHKKLVTQICDLDQYTPSLNPFTLFMAGSPGSGKTEYSKNFLKQLKVKDASLKIIRLDTDELRELIPQYNGHNSDVVQRAATLLFDKAFDCIQDKNLNVVIDTTFASPRSIENVKRALGRNRKVSIIYLYQDPIIAWQYTQKREKLEGRSVPKKIFIKTYFAARKNVNKIKEMFGDEVELHLFEKDKDNNFEKRAKFNIKSLNDHLKENYTKEKLEKTLPNKL